MMRVARALAAQELVERLHDRWVLVVSVLFTLLASAVSAYGDRSSAGEAAALTGPSLVTLASLFVPLVALVLSHDAIVGERERNTFGLLMTLPVSRWEVIAAKFVGRGAALTLAVLLGIGAATALAPAADRPVLVALVFPSLLLGWAFVSIGLLVSAVSARQSTAASLVVVVWFGLVFFYDLGLLGLLVVTDGLVPQQLVADLVVANPAGLYRISMMETFAGGDVFATLGLTASLPGELGRGLLWLTWVAGPMALSGLLVSRQKVVS